MADYIRKYTDKQEELFAKKIRRVYGQASEEVKEKILDYGKKYIVRSAELQELVNKGKLTKEWYERWLSGQVFIGERWKQRLKDVTGVYVNADKTARNILGNMMNDVFSLAANYTAYSMEKDLRFGIAFNLYDTKTVARLLRDNPQMLPEWKIDEPKDYVWNRDRVENALTQGIIQGESISEIADRLSTGLATSNGKKMVLFARTAMTGAQNAGRIDRMKQSQEMGIDTHKKWLATLDAHTRDAHRALDGQEQAVDDPFSSPLGPIDYPGDPSANPANTYNCRCSLLYVYPKYQSLNNATRYDNESGEYIPDMTYAEWEKWKKGGRQ